MHPTARRAVALIVAALAGCGGAETDPRCDADGLTWQTANKTTYTSYPDSGSEECEDYNGCTWAGWFAACEEQQSERWVARHDIAAIYPNFDELRLHDVCVRSGERSMVVTVYDTCSDADCDGCCTENRGDADALIDLESHTEARWGLPDGPVEWADLGPTEGDTCE